MASAAVRINPPVNPVRTLRLDLHARQRTGLRFNLDFQAPDAANGYRIVGTVEWQGDNAIWLPVCALAPFGQPAGWEALKAIRLWRAEPSRGDVLTVKRIVFSDRCLPRPVNRYEDALETFFLPAFWRVADWRVVSPRSAGRLEPFWFWAHLILKAPRAGDWLACEKIYPEGIDLADHDTVLALISFEKAANFDLELKLDGRWRHAIRARRGRGGFDEVAAATGAARRLEGIRLRMTAREAGHPVLTGVVSWIMLRRRGARAEDIRRHGAWFGKMPAPRADAGRLEKEGLPAGLFFGRKDLAALRAKARRGLGRIMWRKIKAAADESLGQDPEPFVGEFLPFRRGESLTREFVKPAPPWFDILPKLGLAYLVTGRTVYARQARRLVLAICRCRHWGTAFIDRFPVGIWGYRAPFYPAHAAEVVATTVDWIAPVLSGAERRFIDRCLLEKAVFGVEAYLERMDYCRWMNQGVVFAGGGVLAARVAGARARALKLAAYLREVIHNYLDEDGATGEGPGYWSYTMTQAAKALLPIARMLNKPVLATVPPAFAKTPEYPIYLRSHASARGGMLNIGDAHYDGTLASAVLLFFARYAGSRAALRTWWDTYGNAPNAPGDAFSFLFFDPALKPRPIDLPVSKCFRGAQRVFWRTGWGRDDLLFMFESGPWGPDHYHPDKNQFLLEGFGERFIIDRGMCDYSDPLAAQMHATWCHNTLTVDGRDQIYFSRQPAAELERLEETADLRYLASEAGKAYGGLLARFRREVLFVRSAYFVVADEVAGARGKLEWHFHSALKPERTPAGFLLRGRRGSLVFGVAGLDKWRWRCEKLASDTAGVPDYHLALAPRNQTPTVRFTAVLYPVRAGREQAIQLGMQADAIVVRRGPRMDRIGMPPRFGGGAAWRIKT
jgi:hypothetical protein